eukprot:snap_masked-scaffold4282_size6248-processed-gene-0.0 protein:Tk09480 transcript:snap_masked-scaffold4282_size6248-processed-gene-0.0-mRNA-1 annotation:"PREDICTED: uncharacterized protein K02A2.6-like"
MKADIGEYVAGCQKCQIYRSSLPLEPFDMAEDADAPMSRVAMDLFEAATAHWLVIVDRFSGYTFLYRLRSLTSAALIAILKDRIFEFGRPERVRTDGGPQFRTEFRLFCDSLDIIHEQSSPGNARSNGLAEAAVKTANICTTAKCSVSTSPSLNDLEYTSDRQWSIDELRWDNFLQVTSPRHVATVVNTIVSEDLKDEILVLWHDLLEMEILPRGFPHELAQTCADGIVAAITTDCIDAITADFADVMGDTLDDASGVVKGTAMRIHLRDDVEIQPLKAERRPGKFRSIGRI